MKANYKVERTSDKKYIVKEILSDLVISHFTLEKDARNFTKALNRKSAFEGK